MALQKLEVPVSFAQGIETKTDDKQHLPGTLTVLQNAVFRKVNQITKRNGYRAFSTRDIDDNEISGSKAIATLNDELLLYTSDTLYAFSPNADRWIRRGDVFNVGLTSEPILRNNYTQSRIQSTAVNNTGLFAWSDSRGDWRYSVIDLETNTYFLQDQQIFSGAEDNVQVAVAGSFMYFFYTEGTNLRYRRFNSANPFVVEAVETPITNLDGASPIYKLHSLQDKIFVSYNSTSGGTSIQTLAIDVDGSVGSAGGIAAETATTAIDVTSDSNSRILVSWNNGTDVKFAGFSFNLLSQIIATTTVESGVTINNISTIETSTDNYTVVYDIDATNDKNRYIRSNTIDSSASIGTPSDVIRSVSLASRTISQNGRRWFIAQHDSTLQSTYFMVDLDGCIASKISPLNAGDHINSNEASNFTLLGDSKYLFSSQIKARLISEDNEITFSLGVNSSQIDFDPDSNYQDAVMDNLLYSTGGILQLYDGVNIVEDGFHLFPEDLTLGTVTAGAGEVDSGTYQYVAVYKWTDNRGQVHRSIPSLPFETIVQAPYHTEDFEGAVDATSFATGSSPTFNMVAGSFIGPITNETTDPIEGTRSIKLEQSTPFADDDWISAPFVSLTATEQNTPSVARADYLYDGDSGDINFVVYDDTNNVVVAETALTPAVSEVKTVEVNFKVDETVTQLIYGFHNKNVNTGKNLIFDNVKISTNTSTNSVDIEVPTLRTTAKDNVVIELYRTEQNGTIFRKVTTSDSPVFNDKTVDTVTVTDTLNDDALLTREILYTTGDILENAPAPNATTITAHKDRIVLAGLEDSTTIAYSKVKDPNFGVEFNEFLDIRLDENGNRVTAVASMDGKLIIFKDSTIFAVAGDGPTATGAQNTFTSPQLIATDVGCKNPDSVVLTPLGIMFQSDKGIYLLTRGLSAQYIGANVEKFNSETITASVLVPDTNQVRFLTANNDCLVYDYLVNQWSTFTNHKGKDALVYDGKFTYLRQDGRVFQEESDFYQDENQFIGMSLETGWISFAGLQGFQRVYKVWVLGELFDKHKLRLRVASDFTNVFLQDKVVDSTEIIDNKKYGEDSPYGETNSVYGGESDEYQIRFDFKKQKTESIKLRIDELPMDDIGQYGQAISLSALTFQVGAKLGGFKIGQSRVKGLDGDE